MRHVFSHNRCPLAARAVAASLAVLIAVLGFGGSAAAQGQGPALVGADPVRTDPLDQTVPVIGRLVARQTGVIAAQTHGPVGEIMVEVGDRVKKDQVIARLQLGRVQAEQRLRKAELNEAIAAVATKKVQLDLVRQELQRLANLRQSAAFSQARYDDKSQEVAQVESEIAEADAEAGRAKAALDLAEIGLYVATTRAPYDGVVSHRHTEVGSYLNAGDPVVTLIDESSLEIEADVPSERIGGMRTGVVVKFDIGERTGVLAAVRAQVPEENPLTRTRRVRLVPQLDGFAGGLAVNQSVTLHVPAGAARQVVTVHKDAVLNRRGSSMVFVIDGGMAQTRPVTLGDAVGGRFEVLSGLQPGDITIIRGNERLIPGQPVKASAALPPASQSNAPAAPGNG